MANGTYIEMVLIIIDFGERFPILRVMCGHYFHEGVVMECWKFIKAASQYATQAINRQLSNNPQYLV